MYDVCLLHFFLLLVGTGSKLSAVTGCQRDLLYVAVGLDEPHGLVIKDRRETAYETAIQHGRRGTVGAHATEDLVNVFRQLTHHLAESRVLVDSIKLLCEALIIANRF